jgi:tetratricopeptide (TPR) repeat protein
MPTRSGWAIALAAGAILSSAVPARAQDRTAEAQARFNDGIKAYKDGNYDLARLNFLQSDALMHRGSVLRNLALTEMQLGRPLDALQHLRAALALPDFDEERRRIAERDLRDAYAATGHIAIDATDGAKVTVDGVALDGAAPFRDPVDVIPGLHVLEAHAGTAATRLEVRAPAGSVATAKLPIDAPAVASEPRGADLALSPIPPHPAASRAPDSPEPRWHPFWTVRREVGVATAAIGLAALAAGAYFNGQGNDARERAGGAVAGLSPWACTGGAQPPGCATARDAWSTQDTDAILTPVFFAVGAAGVLGGAVAFFWPDRSPSTTAIAPVVMAHGGGLRIQGAL